MIVRRPLQSVDSIRFCVDQKELTPELLFEVSLGSNWEDASVRLLVKEVLGLLHSMSILEEGKGPEDFFLVADELLRSQVQVVTNFIRPYLHQFFDDSHGLKASLKPFKRPFD